MHQIDVSNAFLHGHLEEQVFCQQPTGFVDSAHPDHVCLLSRSLYGLKQAPRAWYQRIAAFLHQLGFRSTRSDASLFVYNNGATTAYLLLYVDDIILTASSTDLLRQLTERLRAEFALKDLGPLHYFLGIEVVRRTDGFFLHQRKYAHELLDRAGMLNCKPAATPVDTKSKLSATDGSLATDASSYRSIVGALQYVTLTRPELQYAVQQVCLHMHAPRDPHWAAVKRILRYIRGTMDFGLSLHASTATDIVAYSDADWAGCPDTRRSTSGYCVYFGPSLISWSSKRQPTVSRSSAGRITSKESRQAQRGRQWLNHLWLKTYEPSDAIPAMIRTQRHELYNLGCCLGGRADTRTAARVRVSVLVARGVQRGDPKRRHVVRLPCAALRHGRPRRDSHGGRWNARESSRARETPLARARAQVSRQAAGYKRRRRPHTDRITFLSPSTFSGAMPRTLQTTWAKLSLAARARFPRTAEEERADSRWVADDEALRVAAEAAAKKAGDAEMAEAAAEGWHETADGWYEAAEEGAAAAEEPVQEEDLALANINAAIEERLADLTRVTKEHEATWRAGRRRLGDLLGQKNELLAMRAARHLIQMPSPSGAPRRTLTRRSAAGKSACAGARTSRRPRPPPASGWRRAPLWNAPPCRSWSYAGSG
ncbi:hypothetical protein QYE76_002566 [Lolium multiflorum]|uniref:Reverse transcriptase Ty1/copia-type domain-containing protein n=1 Tax=Lolium multiflorum TaxID=4521 RepID=A0AAD8RLY3_LOLMU|nr:hypothetical protein QYE76_002566 [Lolium multiflorum]